MCGFLNLDDVETLKGENKRTKTTTKKNKVYKEVDPDDLVKMNRKITLDKSDFFTEERFPYSLNFYDFEVFMCDWMVVIINPIECTKRVIVNDVEALKHYYSRHKNQIWVGYNSREYDTFILKSIILGLNPKKTSDMIIEEGMPGWQINDSFRDIQLYDFDLIVKDVGLKQLEGFMGNDIRETEVDFNLDRQLTQREIRQTIIYCIHDVEQTIEVFKRRINDYNAQIDLIETFNLPLANVSRTKTRIVATILGCEKKEHSDEFNFKFVDTLQLNKYKYVHDWFINPENRDYKKSLQTKICGIPHNFGWGGLHGCVEGEIHRKGKIFHVDVTSYYPSIMIRYNFLTRNCKDKNKFKQIYDKRVELKKQGKKKEQAPLKIVLNSTFGASKDKYSTAYDPRQANNVCINGQLMLLDLLEHLEGHCEILQSNTDGIILQVKDDEKEIQVMKDICNEWIERTGMGLGFDEIDEIWQSDVNNYIFRFSNGKLERKGAYVQELDDLKYDLPIINEAIVKYLTEGILVEETINNCKDMIKFQKIVKLSKNYKFAHHNNNLLVDKTYRVFASKDIKDTSITKCKFEGATKEKFADTPIHCFIMNSDIKDMKIVDKLDIDWYIDLAKDRLEKKFGINMSSNSLF